MTEDPTPTPKPKPPKRDYSAEQQRIIDELCAAQKTLAITDEAFAKQYLGGWSAATWSKLRSATYEAKDIESNFAELKRRLRSLNYKLAVLGKADGGSAFYDFDQFAALKTAVRECLTKPGENRLVIYVAPTGAGKSRIIREVSKAETTTIVRANEAWRNSYFFASLDIVEALGGTGKFGSAGEARREVLALLKHERRVLAIDEGNYFGPQSINLLKDILNETDATILLTSTPTHYDKMRRHWGEWSQLQRRVHVVIRHDVIRPEEAAQFLSDAGLNGDSKAGGGVLAKAANQFGGYDFITRVIARLHDTATGAHPTLADVTAAVAFVKTQLGVNQ